MLTGKSAWLASFAIVALLAIFLAAHFWRHTQFHPLAAGDKKPVVDRDDRGFESGRTGDHVASISAEAPLPPENAPLADTFKDLAQWSNAGSAAASMRLYRDLKKCDLRQASQRTLDSVYYHHPGQTDAEYAQQVAEQIKHEPALKKALDQLDGTDKLCKGIDDQTIRASSEYLRQAALQNDTEAMVCYAITYELGPPYLSNAWFDYAARWQREAPQIAQQALDAGLPGILMPLIEAYTPDDPDTLKLHSLHQVIAPDAQMAYTLSVLYARLVQGADLQQVQNNLAALSGELDVDQLANAQAMADALWPRFQQASAAGAPLSSCPEFFSFPSDTIIIEELPKP